uniref:Putative secreted protein n=1 Tax=Ixodes ricinus TaxID=34613 RepID=A0A6B0UJG0_IXORI
MSHACIHSRFFCYLVLARLIVCNPVQRGGYQVLTWTSPALCLFFFFSPKICCPFSLSHPNPETLEIVAPPPGVIKFDVSETFPFSFHCFKLIRLLHADASSLNPRQFKDS